VDFISAFKSELFRPLATLVVPGGVAIGPYVLVAAYYFPGVASFWREHPSAFVAILVICIVAVGLIVEDLGAFIERDLWDSKLARENEYHSDHWEQYLKLKLNDEIVGQRYLRTVLTRMKFELAMVPAFFFFWCGLLWLNRLYDLWRPSRFALLSGVLLVVTIYLLLESFRSASVMSTTRGLIVEAVRDLDEVLERKGENGRAVEEVK
jgi:MFS family permease